jgi:Flp pilus assembly protein TadD
VEARSNLGRVQLQLGRTQEAIATLQAAADSSGSARWQDRVLLARAQCTLARWDECIGTLRAARELAPEEPAISHNLGAALYRRGSYEAAVTEFQQARTLRASDPRALLGLAVSQDKAGRAGEALASYQEYLRLLPAAPAADKIRARVAALGPGTSAP